MKATYSNICANDQRDKKDCTVVMVSVVCDIPYQEAFKLLKEAGRIDGKGCGSAIYNAVIRQQGFKLERLTNTKRQNFVRDGIRPLAAKTVRTIERELARYWGGQKVYINVNRHILAWDGTECVDWTVGRQHRIESAYLVYKGDLPKSGTTVAEPERQSLNRVGQKRTAVMANILGNEPKRYQSCTAAYKALGLDKKGRQKIRRIVKRNGTCTFWAWVSVDGPLERNWKQEHVTITLAE